jgi:transcription elongation GreA/GreB family factor
MIFKENVHIQCVERINEKIKFLQETLADLKESASNETKSTAGDKHETALAMLQIEQENTNKQLENLLSQKLLIEKIVPGTKPQVIANGTLVKTDKGYFYLSVALGKITVDGKTVIALSPQSPLGNKLIGLNVNETAIMNGVKYLIESIE